MQKQFRITMTLLAAVAVPLAQARAQQAPAANPPKAPAAKAGQAPSATTKKAPAAKSAGALVLKTPKDKASYAVGLNIGQHLRTDSIDVDPKIVIQGINDALTGGKKLLTDQETQAALAALQNDMRKKQTELMQQAAGTNKKAGDDFLAANKTKEGVVTLPSGLQYKILKQGTGPKPTASDTVMCHYRGTLLNNTEFDSSYKRGQPQAINLGQVIKGWNEALQLMPVGSKWQLFIPPQLAYGENAMGPVIGPNSTLIFEIELLSIQEKGK
jgi:FKBP-type peptidyl-prolyl cis-trans isomerase FklB